MTATTGTVWVPVIVAVISAIVGPTIGIFLTQRLRDENTKQHAENKAVLQDQHAENKAVLTRLERTLERVDEKTDEHGERLAVVEDRLDIPRRARVIGG